MKGKRESKSKNGVNIKKTKVITFTEPLEQSFSFSPQNQSRHFSIICTLQSLRYETSLSFDNRSLGNSFHENEVTITHVKIEFKLSSPELSMMDKGPKQKYVEVRPLPFQNIFSTDDPINSQLENTGKFLVVL